MSDFDRINNTVDIRHRETTIKLRLKTYGTLEQCQQSVAKVEYKLRLQGLDVEMDDVYTAADDSSGVLGGMIKVREGDMYTSTETIIDFDVVDIKDKYGDVVARAGISKTTERSISTPKGKYGPGVHLAETHTVTNKGDGIPGVTYFDSIVD